ncbi:MAG: LysR family transcriptional regulator substrate-binding protein, partial [Solirubrobacteraceae bacterium]
VFHRIGRGLRLTAAGDALIGTARQVLRAMDEARDAVRGVTELRAGMVELAALSTLSADPLAGLIGRYRELYPGIQVRLLEPDSAEGVSAMVRGGYCELGAAHLPMPTEQLVAHSLGDQELLFVLPPHSALRDGRRPLLAHELAEMPLVVAPPGTSTRMLLEQALAEVGVTPRIAVQTAAREAVVPLVLAGAGAALLPTPLAREAARRGAVVRAARPSITRPIGLIHRAGPLSPAARAFLAVAVGQD